MDVIRFFRAVPLAASRHQVLLDLARRADPDVEAIEAEHCFNVQLAEPLDADGREVLSWLLAETFEPHAFGEASFLDAGRGAVVEVGPRMTFTTAWSSNAVSVCRACDLAAVQRIERSRRFLLRGASTADAATAEPFLAAVHDRMTECVYAEPLRSFATAVQPEPVVTVPV